MGRNTTLKACLITSAAIAFAMPAPASAQTSAELAERVRQLEATLTSVQAELQQLQTREAQQSADIVRIQQAPAAAPAAPAAPTDGFRVGPTTFRLGGYVKAEALYSDYSAGDIATGTGREIDEERRLFYVAMTRARDELRVMTPLRFYVHGQAARGDRNVFASRTRFIPAKALALFERLSWPIPASTAPLQPTSALPRIDVGAKLRGMWR